MPGSLRPGADVHFEFVCAVLSLMASNAVVCYKRHSLQVLHTSETLPVLNAMSLMLVSKMSLESVIRRRLTVNGVHPRVG